MYDETRYLYEKGDKSTIDVNCFNDHIWYIGNLCEKYSGIVRRIGFISGYTCGSVNSNIFEDVYKRQIQSMVKEIFIILWAVSVSFVPLLIENNGAPPPPNRLLNAVMITMIGKHKPTAPKAVVPTPGIRCV